MYVQVRRNVGEDTLPRQYTGRFPALRARTRLLDTADETHQTVTHTAAGFSGKITSTPALSLLLENFNEKDSAQKVETEEKLFSLKAHLLRTQRVHLFLDVLLPGATCLFVQLRQITNTYNRGEPAAKCIRKYLPEEFAAWGSALAGIDVARLDDRPPWLLL